MKRRTLQSTLPLLTLAAPAVTFAAQQPQSDKPLNVLLIMTDDQGYGDVGYVGNPNINTPYIDQLASESVVYDNFHTGTTSAPTRSGLMTGRYGNATGVWHTIGGRSILDLEEYTLGQAFQDSGYATAHFGKWHLGDNYPYRPMDRGFEKGLWHKGGGVGQTPDYYNNTYFEDTYFRGDTPEKQTGYCTDIFFNETERFITESLAEERPFFCYLALNAPHSPYNVDERYAAPYRNNKAVNNAQFYGMISNIDENIGRLRALLSRLEIDDNTIVILFGDNGSAGGVSFNKKTNEILRGYNGGFRGVKGEVYEGGHRQAMVMHVPGAKAGKEDGIAAYIDIMPTLIEKCGLTPSKKVDYDGVNILGNYDATGRVFVNDTQRDEELVEDKKYCVARDNWRLISGTELYDLSKDRAQKNNVAEQYPEVVKELKAEYKKWWKKSSMRANQNQYIPLVNPNCDVVRLTCHDIHDKYNTPNVWNFKFLHSDMRPSGRGWWSVSLEKPTTLQLDAFRWSPESGIGLGEPAPEGRLIPCGKRYPAGFAIDDMVSLTVKVNGRKVAKTTDIDLKKPSATIPKVKLPKGEFDLQVIFTNDKGEEYSAWYVTLTAAK